VDEVILRFSHFFVERKGVRFFQLFFDVTAKKAAAS
jgi:hypothetical protein